MSSTSTITHHINHSHRITNGTQACAACKYQRRKCAPDCILAPYFPHDRQRQFLNAHKLFGVSNITKIIRNLHPPEKDIAMRTIIFQSDMRAKDPVGGCYRIIQFLQHQVECHKAELEAVLHQIAVCRAQQVAYQQQHQMQVAVDHDRDDQNNDDPTTSSYEILQEYNHHQGYQGMSAEEDQEYVNAQLQHQQLHDHDGDSGAGGDDVLNHDHHNHDVQHFQCSWGLEGENDRCGEVKSPIDHGVDFGHEHVEVESFEKGGLFKFDPQQAMEKSDIMLKAENITLEDEATAFQQQQIPEHDLRSAATLFTLTS